MKDVAQAHEKEIHRSTPKVRHINAAAEACALRHVKSQNTAAEASKKTRFPRLLTFFQSTKSSPIFNESPTIFQYIEQHKATHEMLLFRERERARYQRYMDIFYSIC